MESLGAPRFYSATNLGPATKLRAVVYIPTCIGLTADMPPQFDFAHPPTEFAVIVVCVGSPLACWSLSRALALCSQLLIQQALLGRLEPINRASTVWLAGTVSCYST